MKRLTCATFLLGLTLLNSSCLSSLLGTQESKSSDYHFPIPDKTWESIDPAEADAAFRNPKDQAILNITSVCGEGRFRSLEDLTDDLLRQLPSHQLVGTAESRRVDGHPALVSEAKGQVDGDPLEVRVAIIRTADCVYDIIIAAKSLDPSSREVFEQTLAGFRSGRQP